MLAEEEQRKFTPLEWDSQKFGYKIARINLIDFIDKDLTEVLEELKRLDYKLAYFSTQPYDIFSQNLITKLGGFFAAENLMLARLIENEDKAITQSDKIRSMLHANITPRILEIALQAGYNSRFKTDPGFKNNEYYRLYKEWITKSLSGEIAMDVLVHEAGEEVSGLITVVKKGDNANIGILSVDEKHRRQGIGKELVQAAFKLAALKGYKKINVSTQRSNKNACLFYESLGFQVESSENIYHFWINEN